MASASGIRLLSDDEKNPEAATTYGTGQLIRRAIELGCTEIVLGAGGSATVDGGAGILEALGFVFLDAGGKSIPGRPDLLSEIKDIRRPSDLKEDIKIVVLCDVINPLLGENGAANVFGPQKGAGPDMVNRLENGLKNWVSLLENISGRELRNVEGSGAAGGIGCGIGAFFNTNLVRGADYIFNILQIDRHLEWADLVITGEGKIDRQSLSFKAPCALAARAGKAGKPVAALAGYTETTDEHMFDAVFSIVNKPMSLQKAMSDAPLLAAESASQVAGYTVRINPELYELHKLFGNLRSALQSGNLKEAESLLGSIDPRLANYWYYKGMIFKKQQHWSEALNAFHEALEIDNGHLPARAASDMIKNILRFTNPHLLDP